MHLKLLQKERFKKTAEANGDFIDNKIAYRVTKVSKNSPKNNSERNEEEILRERSIPSELRHEIINDLRLRGQNC